MIIDEGGKSENRGRFATIFPNDRCPTTGGVLTVRGIAGVAQEKTGLESINCLELD